MKSFLISCSTLLFILVGVQTLQAQSYINLGGFFGQPYGEFSNEDYRPGGGFQAEIISKEALPRFLFNFQYGAHADFLFSGGESFNARFPLNDYRLQLSNQSFGGHIFARMTTIKAGIRFYGDVLAGSRLFYTTLTTFSNNDWESDNDNTDWLTGKLTAYYGVSGGLQIKLAPLVYLDGRVTQTFGTPVRYVNLSSLDYSNGYLDYVTQQASHSDMIHFQLGVTFQMWEDNRMNQARKKKQKRPQKKRYPDQPIERPGPQPLPKS